MKQKVVLYKKMSKCYWERWHWELQKRKEALEQLQKKARNSISSQVNEMWLHEISPSLLTDPVRTTDSSKLYIGRGSFGIVKLQMYRGIEVAVKEFLPHTNLADVQREALILNKLSHPYLPHFFGVCTQRKPYCLVTQFCCVNRSSTTLSDTVLRNDIALGITWLDLCVQFMEALRYIHNLHILLKSNNIILSEAPNSLAKLHMVLIDFGKASFFSEKKRLRLSEGEKAEYTRRFPHISPEVVGGESPYSYQSDIFSAGVILYHLDRYKCFSALSDKQKLTISDLTAKCRANDAHNRPTQSAFLTLELLLKEYNCN